MIETILEQIHYINQTYDILATLWEVFQFIIIFSMAIISFSKIKERIRNHYYQRLFGFNKKLQTEVMLPTLKGNLDYTPKEILKRGIQNIRTNEYITLSESEALLYTVKLLIEYGVKEKIIFKSSNDNFNAASNKIIIGGPLNNIYLHDIFSKESNGIYSFDGKFQFGVKHYWMSRHNNDLYSDIEKEISDKESSVLFYKDKNGKENKIHISHKYIILIKLSKKDIKITNSGPLLICFGNTAAMTNKAIQSLSEYIYDLSKHIRNKRHFFVIFKCTTHGDLQFSSKEGVIDLTDVMF